MKEPRFKVGQTVWIDNGHRDRFSGEVVQIIPEGVIKHYGTHYVIEVFTNIDDYLQIRDEDTVYETADEPNVLMKAAARFKRLPKSLRG